MNYSRRTQLRRPVATASHRSSRLQGLDDGRAHPPRWGLLATAILAALVTAMWIGSAFSEAQPVAAATLSAAATAK